MYWNRGGLDRYMPSTHDVTQLLKAWTTGDEQALEKLTPLVYEQLHRIAQRCMAGERTGHTLQATALVNEVYLQLVDCRQINWQDRAHFFAVSAQLMRRILVDFARSRGYQKRGGGAPQMSLDEVVSVSNEPDTNLVALDDALKGLAALDGRKSRVIELRFFGGLSIDETAEVLRVYSDTVVRDWKVAKVWLLRELSEAN
jgi:RNA polymerase sigma factor (TIGR02999 family)